MHFSLAYASIYDICLNKRYTNTTQYFIRLYLQCYYLILNFRRRKYQVICKDDIDGSWCLTCLGCVLRVYGCLGQGVVQDTSGVQGMPHPPLQIVPALVWAALTCTWHIYKHSVVL